MEAVYATNCITTKITIIISTKKENNPSITKVTLKTAVSITVESEDIGILL
jgi:hypothetical protein